MFLHCANSQPLSNYIYHSPHFFDVNKADEREDIYALGMLCLEVGWNLDFSMDICFLLLSHGFYLAQMSTLERPYAKEVADEMGDRTKEETLMALKDRLAY